MDVLVFFQQMSILYAIALIGFFARKKGIFNQHANDLLTQLILSLTLPFLIIYSLDQPNPPSAVATYFLLIPMSVFVLAIACLLAFLLEKLLHLPTDRQAVFQGLIIFGNQGFIGFAIVSTLFPQHGALYATLFNLPYLLLIWTYGVYLFVGKQDIPWKNILLNPGVLATLFGIVLFLLPFRLPAVLSEVFGMVGQMTIPLSMLVIGVFIANINMTKTAFIRLLQNKTIWLITAFRLIIIPVFLFPFFLFGLPYPLLATVVLVTATPAAPTIALFAQKYGGDRELAALTTCWTTLLSGVTLPGLYLLVYLMY